MIRRIWAALRRTFGFSLGKRVETRDSRTICIVSKISESILSASRARGLYLDRAAVGRLLATGTGSTGAIRPVSAGRLSTLIARRAALRFARTDARKMQLDPKLVADALFFDVWSQLCVIIPLRHLARKLARQANGETILIHLPTTNIACFELWKPNQIEPLVLYSEIVRRGGNALLHCPSLPVEPCENDESERALRLRVPATWWAPPLPTQRPGCSIDSRRAFVSSAVRGFDLIMSEHGPMHLVACAVTMPIAACETLMPAAIATPQIAIPLVPRQLRTKHGAFAGYTGDLANVTDYLLEFFRELLPAAARNAENVITQRDINEVHCCDHSFFESALMCHAVKKKGGRVVLWPHSANPNQPGVRPPGDADEISCITESGKRIWQSYHPGIPVAVRPELMLLRAPQRPYPSDAAAPLSVILIGGAQFLGRLPVIPIEKHNELYREFFRRLREHSATIKVYFRPKPLFEDEKWLRDELGIRDGYELAQREPMAIEVPNPIFVMISLASTAVLEGIGRGIPSLIVREFPVDDYIHVDPRSFPMGSVDFIVDHLIRCRDEKERAEILSKQIGWYQRETGAVLQ